jgi:hypothetical protein
VIHLCVTLAVAWAAWAGVQPVVFGGKPGSEPSPYWRSVVAIDLDPGDYTGVLPCSGVLVSRRVVLTAAHCARPAAGGGLIALSFFDRAGRVWRKVPIVPSSARVHPEYDAASSRNELALVPVPIELPEDYRPAALLEDEGRLAPAESIELAGVGRTESGRPAGLRSVAVPIKEVRPEDQAFSAYDPEQRRIACDGDSGGGAFLDDGRTLAGLIFLAWEPIKHPCSGPGTTWLMSIPRYKAWIDENVAELQR